MFPSTSHFMRPEGSNPDPAFHHLQHVYTLLVNRQQVDELLIPKIEEYRNKFPCRPSAGTREDNRFVGTGVWKGLDDRMSLPFHSIVSPQVAQNKTIFFFIPSLSYACNILLFAPLSYLVLTLTCVCVCVCEIVFVFMLVFVLVFISKQPLFWMCCLQSVYDEHVELLFQPHEMWHFCDDSPKSCGDICSFLQQRLREYMGRSN